MKRTLQTAGQALVISAQFAAGGTVLAQENAAPDATCWGAEQAVYYEGLTDDGQIKVRFCGENARTEHMSRSEFCGAFAHAEAALDDLYRDRLIHGLLNGALNYAVSRASISSGLIQHCFVG